MTYLHAESRIHRIDVRRDAGPATLNLSTIVSDGSHTLPKPAGTYALPGHPCQGGMTQTYTSLNAVIDSAGSHCLRHPRAR